MGPLQRVLGDGAVGDLRNHSNRVGDSMSDTETGDYHECPDCGGTAGTNGECLACLYAYEAGIGPHAERDGI